MSDLRSFSKELSEKELAQAIKSTKLKKQPGPNNIYPEYVHSLESKALKTLLTIYNTFWNI